MSTLPSLPLPAPEPTRAPAPAEPTTGNRRYLGWLALLLAALAGGLWLYLRPDTGGPGGAGPAAIQTAAATRGDLEVRLRLTGVTSARNFANIAAPRVRGPGGGRDLNILDIAPSGTMVSKGQVVAELDAQDTKDHLDDEMDSLRNAGNTLEKLKVQQELDMVNLEQTARIARAALDKARLDQKTTEIRTDIDRELLRLAVEEADAAHKETLGEIAQEKVSQRAELRMSEIAYQLQKIRVDRNTLDVKNFTIRTPMAGMAVMMTQNKPGGDQTTIQKGDRVSPGQPFMKVIDSSTMQVDALINQAESSLLRIGQDAVVNLDAFPGVTFHGKVFSIGALASAPGRSQYFIRNLPVRVQITQVDKRIIPDLSASADILLEKHPGAVLVPSSAIERDGKRAYVQVKNAQGAFEKREVGTGAANGVQTAIASGLKEGEQVRLN